MVSFRSLAFLVVVFSILGNGCADPPPTEDSAAGDSIATAAPGTDVYVAPLDATVDSLRVGSPTPVTTRSGYDNQPAFLPEENGLVWTSIRNGQADIYRSGKTGEPSRLTNTPESEFSPTPRPKGQMTVVRVEADGRQRLWRYRLDGTPVEPVLPDADSVGYHAWLDSTRVALFVLGSPPTLHVADVAAGTDTVVATRIGRSLRTVPGTADVSFVQVGPDSTTAIHVLDGETLNTRRLTATLGNGAGDFHAWGPSGYLFMAAGNRLQAWHPESDRWRTAAKLDTMNVSRLAVSSDGDRLAFVVDE
mgnify:CR=1 FL=1